MHGRPGPRRWPHEPVPRSVDDLARDTAWCVARNVHDGRWHAAERVTQAHGHHWRIGLTPVADIPGALNVWCADTVVGYRCGNGATVTGHARRWVTAITHGTIPLR